MEVGESVPSSLRRILTKEVLAAVKPAIAEEIGNLGERVDAIIQNATEVRLVTGRFSSTLSSYQVLKFHYDSFSLWAFEIFTIFPEPHVLGCFP